MPWILGVVLVIFLPLAGMSIYVGKVFLDSADAFGKWKRRKIRLTIILFFGYLNLLPITFFTAFLFLGRKASIYFSGDYFLIDLFITYPFWFYLVILFQLFILFSVFQLFSWLASKVFLNYGERLKLNRHRIVSWVTFIITFYSIGTIIDNTWFTEVVFKKIEIPSGMKQLSGMRIVQISDVQGDGRTTERILNEYVQKVNALDPDLIIYTGDLVTSGVNYIASTARVLGTLKPKHSLITVLGDHDYFSDSQMVIGELTKNQVPILQDSTIQIEVQGTPIKITGITYTYRKRPSEQELNNHTDKSITCYKIMISHQPAEELVDFASEQGYQLFLAGHTHGGGIAFGIPGLFLIAPANFESRYVSGFYQKGATLISITNGLGFTLAPIRFHAPAQIPLCLY